jgi:hypothetical protein
VFEAEGFAAAEVLGDEVVAVYGAVGHEVVSLMSRHLCCVFDEAREASMVER